MTKKSLLMMPIDLAQETMWQGESKAAPTWMALRVAVQGGPYWAWLIHPDQASKFRAGLGPLAIGREDWDALYIGAIARGIVNELYHEAELAGDVNVATELVEVDSLDNSRRTRKEFLPFAARDPVQIVWASLRVKKKKSKPEIRKLVARVDECLARQFESALPVFGPFPESNNPGPFTLDAGSDISALIAQANSMWEARLIEQGTSSKTSAMGISPRL